MPAKMNTVSMPSSPTARWSKRGFTLIELMAVVVITGILAVAGVSLFQQQLLASKGTEAVSVIQAIRAAEEAYAAENHVYLNVSTASGGTSWYPNEHDSLCLGSRHTPRLQGARRKGGVASTRAVRQSLSTVWVPRECGRRRHECPSAAAGNSARFPFAHDPRLVHDSGPR